MDHWCATIADIVILDADPSENIAVLGDPAYVRVIIKDGDPLDLRVVEPRFLESPVRFPPDD